jgi:hypothetical protein
MIQRQSIPDSSAITIPMVTPAVTETSPFCVLIIFTTVESKLIKAFEIPGLFLINLALGVFSVIYLPKEIADQPYIVRLKLPPQEGCPSYARKAKYSRKRKNRDIPNSVLNYFAACC